MSPVPHATVDVLIADGGPFGLMLANEPGRRGVSVALFDAKPSTAVNPPANATQARTMEHYRRRYDESPVIVRDGSQAPPDAANRYEPSASPGGRAPHVWLDDGRHPARHRRPRRRSACSRNSARPATARLMARGRRRAS